MQKLGSQDPTARRRPRLAGAWLDCSAVAYYPGVVIGIVVAGAFIYLLLGVAE